MTGSDEAFVRLMLSDHVNNGSDVPVREYGNLRAAEAVREVADSLWDHVLAGLVSIDVVRKIRNQADALDARP